MTSPISSGINAIQFFNATNAFKVKPEKNIEQQEDFLPQSEGLVEENNLLLDKYNIDEIKKYATQMGEANLSNEDIKYGLVYGRSVIVDYSA